jgi:hypothetical protein
MREGDGKVGDRGAPRRTGRSKPGP